MSIDPTNPGLNGLVPAGPMRIGPMRTGPSVAGGAHRPEPGRAGPASLVAGAVPGRIDFTVTEAASERASLPFYRHPADQNSAATHAVVGRAIDVEA